MDAKIGCHGSSRGQDFIMNLHGVDSQQPLADIGPDAKDKLLIKIRSFMTIISSHIRSSRQHILKPMHALDKFQKLCQTGKGALKYQYALSSTKSMLYQLHIHVTQGLKVIYEASHPGMGGASASSGPLIDVGSQGNMVRLEERQDLPDEYHRPEFIKQRTEECFALRKQPRVTGSSLHNAIGLRTLTDQKLHFDVHVSGQPMPRNVGADSRWSRRRASCCSYPSSWLSARDLSIQQPGWGWCQVHTYKCRYCHRGIYWRVSSEWKPSVPYRNQVSSAYLILYSSPVSSCTLLCVPAAGRNDQPQCEEGIVYILFPWKHGYISEVRFDVDLWHKIVEEVDRVYGTNMKRPTQLGPVVHELKTELTTYVENNISLLVELPSLRTTVVAEAQTSADSPYMYTAKKSTAPQVTVNKFLQSVTEGIEFVKEGYRLGWQKASEVLAFVLWNVDWQQNQFKYNLPSEIARGMLKSVIQTLYANGSDLACLSTDDQSTRSSAEALRTGLWH